MLSLLGGDVPVSLIFFFHQYTFCKKYFKDVSREFDEFQVNYSSLQAALLVLVIYYMGEFLLGGVLFFVHYSLMISVVFGLAHSGVDRIARMNVFAVMLQVRY